MPELANGYRTGIRLNPATWRAVDWIVSQQGHKWSEWAREQLEQKPDADNMTAVIRAAAMDALLVEITWPNTHGQSTALQKFIRY